jgi:hypothetical protein
VDWAAVAHPQTNGQVECANGMILQGLKPWISDRLNKSGQKWLQELRQSFEALGPPRAKPRDSPHFSWSTARRRSSPRTWSMGRLGSRAMTKTLTSKPARTHWTNWTRPAP